MFPQGKDMLKPLYVATLRFFMLHVEVYVRKISCFGSPGFVVMNLSEQENVPTAHLKYPVVSSLKMVKYFLEQLFSSLTLTPAVVMPPPPPTHPDISS